MTNAQTAAERAKYAKQQEATLLAKLGRHDVAPYRFRHERALHGWALCLMHILMWAKE